MKNNTKGLRHLIKAFGFSIDGFKWIFRNEAAFRHDLVFSAAVVAVVAAATGFAPARIFLAAAAACVLLIAELLNSAVECVVDMVSPEYSALAKAAKDMCSAAVFVAVVLVLMSAAAAIFI